MTSPSGPLTNEALERMAALSPHDVDLGMLTGQEFRIAIAVAGGLTNKEAASALFVSPKTVEGHLGRIYSKLNLRSRTQLANLIHSRLVDES